MRRGRRKIRGRFCERTVEGKSAFARKSFRWKRSGRAWVLIGCPRGRWRRGRCSVGTRAHKVLAPARGRCRSGTSISK